MVNFDIMPQIGELRNLVSVEGEKVGDTLEYIGANLSYTFNPGEDLVATGRRAIERYGKKDWKKKYYDEHHHYKMITYGMIHKAKEVRFFHKQGLDSRKIVLFSTDCISFLQMIKRGNRLWLFCTMRSSDILDLLPLDVMALCELAQEYFFFFKKECKDVLFIELRINIISAHYYLKNSPRS